MTKDLDETEADHKSNASDEENSDGEKDSVYLGAARRNFSCM